VLEAGREGARGLQARRASVRPGMRRGVGHQAGGRRGDCRLASKFLGRRAATPELERNRQREQQIGGVHAVIGRQLKGEVWEREWRAVAAGAMVEDVLDVGLQELGYGASGRTAHRRQRRLGEDRRGEGDGRVRELMVDVREPADQIVAPGLYSSSPLWAVAACMALVWRRGGVAFEGKEKAGSFGFSLVRAGLFAGAHILLVSAARSLHGILQPVAGTFSLGGWITSALKLSVLLPTLLLLPLATW